MPSGLLCVAREHPLDDAPGLGGPLGTTLEVLDEEVPKSIIAAGFPSRTSRFPAATSPWNQTGSPRQPAETASSRGSPASQR